MARKDETVLAADLSFIDDLRRARDEEHVLPGVVEMPPEQQAEAFRNEIAHAPHSGREMAGPYVQSFYGGRYADDATLPNWLAHASNDHVLHFMGMHAEVRDGLQTAPAVRSAFFEARQRFVAGLYEGMQAGWIAPTTHPSGRNVHIEHMEQTEVRIGDIGDTYLFGQEAYLDGSARAVVVAPGAGPHFGARVADACHRIDRTAPRVLAGMYGRGAVPWVRTAFAEHLKQGVYSGDYATLDPASRGERSPFAAEQRALLGALLAPGGAELTRLFSLAMTSKDSNSREWDTFRATFDRVWGVRDGFDTASRYVSGLQDDFKRLQPDAVALEHQQWAAQRALESLEVNPAEVFGSQVHGQRVGILAMAGGGRHRR